MAFRRCPNASTEQASAAGCPLRSQRRSPQPRPPALPQQVSMACVRRTSPTTPRQFPRQLFSLCSLRGVPVRAPWQHKYRGDTPRHLAHSDRSLPLISHSHNGRYTSYDLNPAGSTVHSGFPDSNTILNDNPQFPTRSKEGIQMNRRVSSSSAMAPLTRPPDIIIYPLPFKPTLGPHCPFVPAV